MFMINVDVFDILTTMASYVYRHNIVSIDRSRADSGHQLAVDLQIYTLSLAPADKEARVMKDAAEGQCRDRQSLGRPYYFFVLICYDSGA